MGFLRQKRREDPRIDLTPMVDAVFLLLIFFMISTTFVDTSGITVKLPQSSSHAVVKKPEDLKVYLSKSGAIFFQKQEVSLAEFRSRLEPYRRKAGETTFLLYADKDTRHGRVVQLMDVAREAGFRKLAIATEERPKR
jgi:biopolymer transport protein ExbD